MQKFLIVGLKTSGISAAKMLNSVGKEIFLYDCESKTIRKARKACSFLDKKCFVTHIGKKLLKQIDCIVLSPGVKSDEWQKIAFENNIELVSEIEIAFRFCKGITAAITGTNGKTTTTVLLNNILNNCGIKSFAVGNVGNAFSNECLKIEKRNVAVCEASSFQLENIINFKPKVAGFLNLRPDHLDRYKDFDEYKSAKEKIFKNLDKDCFAVLNYNDVIVKSFKNSRFNILWFSIKGELPYGYDGFYLQKNYVYYVKNNKKERVFLKNHIKLPGLHNLQNIMCASLMARTLGIDFKQMRKIIYNFRGLEHRIEFVAEISNAKFYNDSKATNIASTIAAVNCFANDIILILGGSDKGENFATLFESLPSNVKMIFAYGQTATKIVEHAVLSGYKCIKKFDSLENAFKELIKCVYDGCVVLFSPACASFDQFINFEERGDRFKHLVWELMD